jgi:uncharacterized protein YycO
MNTALAAYYGKSFGSWVIRFRTWSKVTHVALVDLETMRTCEAWKGSVQIVGSPMELHTPGTHIAFYELKDELSELQEQELWGFLEEQEGKPYDWGAILGFGLRRNKEDPNKWFCSELAAAAYELVGVPLLERIDRYKIYPELLTYSTELADPFDYDALAESYGGG